jgi:hypothetical protein
MNSYMMQGMAAGRGKDLRKQAVVARRAKLARRVRRAGHLAEI